MSINLFYLNMAGGYAKKMSGCTKVSVGSCIVTRHGVIILGANKVAQSQCKTEGCLRVAKYGDNAKTHRNPDDCLAIHSEIDAICNAAKEGVSLDGATIFVTRYPCEACARAIVEAGIQNVIYGRNQPISDMTKKLFDSEGIYCYNESKYMEDDTVV